LGLTIWCTSAELLNSGQKKSGGGRVIGHVKEVKNGEDVVED
jgi:hypothetical protein